MAKFNKSVVDYKNSAYELFVLYRVFDVASSLLMLDYQNVSPWAVFVLSFLVKAGNH